MSSQEDINKLQERLDRAKMELANERGESWEEETKRQCREWWLSPGGRESVRKARANDWKN